MSRIPGTESAEQNEAGVPTGGSSVAPKSATVSARPWAVDWFYGRRLGVRDHNGEMVASVLQGGFREANARLIAAAPDLYEALSNLMENPLFQTAVGGNPIRVDAMLAQARAALKKARGES